MSNSIKVYAGFLLATAFLAITVYMIYPKKDFQKTKYELPDSFETFYTKRLDRSRKEGARPDNEERLLRFSPEKTEFAILYIHGFGASRGEGEAVIDRLATHFKANTYYLRLPGHGTNIEDHATRRYKDYLRETEETLQMMPLLGKKVIVAGTSTGALIGTWLSAEYPELVDGLIMVSPFFAFGNPLGNTASIPGGTHLMSLVMGPIRLAGGFEEDDTGLLHPSYNDFWYVNQYYNALRPLALLRSKIAQPSVFRRVTAPTLMIYYYRDEENQDKTAKVSAMLDAFSQFGGSNASPLNRAVRISYGTHVLLSKHVESDKETITESMINFTDDLRESFASSSDP